MEAPVPIAPAATGTQAAFAMESGLQWQGSRYNAGGGHPNSWVSSNYMARLANGNISHEMDPQKDRMSRLARFDGVTAIIGQMRANPGNERVQRLGCFSLAEITYANWDYTVKAAISRGAAAVVMAMTVHPDSDGLQHWGCAALAQMAQGSEVGRRLVVAEGGATAVAAAMARFAEDEEIQTWGTQMLSYTLHESDGKPLEPLQTPGRSFGGVLAQAREAQKYKQLGY